MLLPWYGWVILGLGMFCFGLVRFGIKQKKLLAKTGLTRTWRVCLDIDVKAESGEPRAVRFVGADNIKNEFTIEQGK